MSGDPTKIGTALAPEISAGQQQTQQAKNQLAQFSGRSGGTAAAAAGMDASNRGNLIKLIGRLQSGSASSLLSSGQSLLGTALGGYNQLADLSQTRLENWQNSIFGGAITGGAAIGMQALGAAAGGPTAGGAAAGGA